MYGSMQAPLSRFEEDQFVNDRYAAIEERLAVRLLSSIGVIIDGGMSMCQSR